MAEATAPAGAWKDGRFYFPARVYYEDTDAGGIVYYANYLKFAERARTEFLRVIGFNQQPGLEADERAGFVVRHCEIDYRAPAVLDDLLEVSCEVKEFGGASAVICQEIVRNGQVLVSLEVKVVYVLLKNKRPARIPAELAEKCAAAGKRCPGRAFGQKRRRSG